MGIHAVAIRYAGRKLQIVSLLDTHATFYDFNTLGHYKEVVAFWKQHFWNAGRICQNLREKQMLTFVNANCCRTVTDFFVKRPLPMEQLYKVRYISENKKTSIGRSESEQSDWGNK